MHKSFVLLAVLVSTTTAFVSHKRPASTLSTHIGDACKLAVNVQYPYGFAEEREAYVRGAAECSTPDRYFCAWTVRKGLPEGAYELWKPHNAGCFLGKSHCESIDSKLARNRFAVKKQCNDELHCVFNDGNQFADYDCHPELLEPSKKYAHICGKCVFVKPSIRVLNQSGVIRYIPVAGGPAVVDDVECRGDQVCLDLLSSAEWDARAVQLEAMGSHHSNTEELYQKAASTRTRLLGPQHPDTQTSYRSLARFYAAAGMYSQSRAMSAWLTRPAGSLAGAGQEALYAFSGEDSRMAVQPSSRKLKDSSTVHGR